MMDDRPDLERRRDIDGLGYPAPATNDDASFAVPAIIIAAILIIGGYFVVTYNSDNVRTASNNTPTQSAPAPKAPATTPSAAPPAPAHRRAEQQPGECPPREQRRLPHRRRTRSKEIPTPTPHAPLRRGFSFAW